MGKKGKRKAASSRSGKKVPKHNQEVLQLCSEIIDVCAKEFPLLQQAQLEDFVKIHGIVEQIREKQSGECIPWENYNRGDNIEDFMSWFSLNGGMANNMKIHKFGAEGYGLIAVEDIEAKENFVTVPKELMMTLESARKSELGALIDKDHVLSCMPHVAIALHVLCEKLNDESWWKPYLNILPSSYTTSLYFNPDDLKPLQGTCTLGDAVKPYRSIARQYAYFYRLFHNGPRVYFKHFFTFDDFRFFIFRRCLDAEMKDATRRGVTLETKKPEKEAVTDEDGRWAVSTVMTRQNQVPVSDSESIKALIPMWDMCNHTNGTIETGFDTKDQTCKSFALRSFAKGEQLLIFYGKRSNADLLFHNGFVFPDNQHDFVNIHLGVSKNDKLYAMKAQILAMVGFDACARPYPVLRGSDPITPELRTFLRIFSMDHDELKIRLFNPEGKVVLPLSQLPNPDVVVSELNEIRMLHYLNIRLNLIASQHKTTLQDDEKLLQSTELTSNAKNCLLLRLIERRILHKALDYTNCKLEEAKKTREQSVNSSQHEESSERENGAGSLEDKESVNSSQHEESERENGAGSLEDKESVNSSQHEESERENGAGSLEDKLQQVVVN